MRTNLSPRDLDLALQHHREKVARARKWAHYTPAPVPLLDTDGVYEFTDLDAKRIAQGFLSGRGQ